jgi:hypothetical protein
MSTSTKRGTSAKPRWASIALDAVPALSGTRRAAPLSDAPERHQFLQFEPVGQRRREVRDAAKRLVNQYVGMSLSTSKLQKLAPRPVDCWETDKKSPSGRREWTSNPIGLRLFEEHLEQGYFDHESFNLFKPECQWLDANIHIAQDLHFVDANGDVLKWRLPTQLGEKFPIVPLLDREGTAFTSFQALLLKRIVALRETVVAESANFGSEDWFQNLRAFVTECVSLIDVTLHQLYHKAEHSPLPGWSFDPSRLGDRHGRRLLDKVKWVYQITRKELHAPAELEDLKVLKGLRNHLQHFDPPCFCYTLEDVVGWLNLMPSIAELSVKIRDCVGSPISAPLVKMLLAPKVRFVPKYPDRPRVPPLEGHGYASTRPALIPNSSTSPQERLALANDLAEAARKVIESNGRNLSILRDALRQWDG